MTVERGTGFSHLQAERGLLATRTDEFPTNIYGWSEETLALDLLGTHFGFVTNREAQLECAAGRFTLHAGMYFAAPSALRVTGGQGIIITRLSYQGLFSIGGPVETTGRLRYIDGCTDTLLISPVMLGDPCLNLLHIPRHTQQSSHTHPSVRAGVIIRGNGRCVLPGESVTLVAGMRFLIDQGTVHSFQTSDSDLLVLAYHPDSDFGPTHESHPMVNRTILEQRPAVQ